MKTAQLFNAFSSPLLRGINLCEASAGTGKTYAIAMLVLRFVVEENIDIKQILVVTFTKAATEELKERIHTRLQAARLAASGSSHQRDPQILSWLQSLAIPLEQIRRRLELALLDIDQAGIFTIHGFCQRVLNEHALESGQLFDVELTSEIALIKQSCADDFWRKQIYQRDAWTAALLTTHYATPDALLASIQRINPQAVVYPAMLDLETGVQKLKACSQHAATAFQQASTIIQEQLESGNFKADYALTFTGHQENLQRWLLGEGLVLPIESLLHFTQAGFMQGLNGHKFRGNKTQTAEQRKLEYIAQLELELTPFDNLAAAFNELNIAFRLALFIYIQQAVEQHLQQLNVLTFDDLISRLAQALQTDKAALLNFELRQRFQVALIDEFQDTDQQQWQIFSTLFGTSSDTIANTFLYLIGDPKQAIYKFRGADINSYFVAQQQAEHQFTLGQNWRSHPHLVQAVNTLFQRSSPFLFPQLEFIPVQPALKAQDGCLLQAGQDLPVLHLWQLAPSSTADGYWTAVKAAQEISVAVINEVLQLLRGDCVLQQGESSRNLQPKDIAILVRSNIQAREYQHYLRELGIPAVLNSTESVLVTSEALDLYQLLLALVNPSDLTILKQALGLSWFGFSGQQLYQLLNDETGLDVWIFRFQEYALEWQKTGLMAMLRHLLTRENVYNHIAELRFAERSLTNIHHLIELLQQAVLEEHLGVQKTVEWLLSAIKNAELGQGGVEEQQLRLESDEDAIKLVTMHRSKGLEYGVVFCPFLWQRHMGLSKQQEWVQCYEQGRTIVDLGSAEFYQRKQQALTEELAEELRVFYVAVTRAKYRCYIAWADVRSKETPNDSAFAYLLELGSASFPQQQAQLQDLVAQYSQAMHYQLLEVGNVISGSYLAAIETEIFTAKRRSRNLYSSWQMSSYTALSTLSLKDAPELPIDKVGEQLANEHKINLATEFPRGLEFGNVIHTLLETLSFKAIAQGKNLVQQREKICQRYGFTLENPERLDVLLQQVVNTPLTAGDKQFSLQYLAEDACLKEMPFYLAMQALDASQINGILEACPVYQALTAKQMSGFLTGFIDLVCIYQGKYYIMDYKSNLLADYQEQDLAAAMCEHNYGLQYWLYSVVLHQYLQQRLPNYSYERHFGGVYYLFVRGMQVEKPRHAVFQDKPDLVRLTQLSKLFAGE